MEIAIVVFLGAWLSGAALFAYRQLKRDYANEIAEIEKSERLSFLR